MRFCIRRVNQKGFTLSEIIIAVLITSIFMASFYLILSGMNGQIRRGIKYFDTNTSAKNIISRITKDAKEAVAIVYNYGLNGGVTTSNNSLVLKLPSIDADGKPTNITSQFDYVTYRLTGTQVLRSLDVLDGTSVREGGIDANAVVVGSEVNNIGFSHDGKGLSACSQTEIEAMKYLSIDITTRATTLGTNQSSQISSDVNLMAGSLS